ncbi:hypothetical protein GUJ93_ZPchr0002g25067 [Zizania palustris]|uniref:Uncharacterized protein n=1 Tax=Zizania palustris TaxID=103762 RepID=A0A8J5S3S4_ZIZPA|nr:hypothetical protein GUJ93_ZPchr0002g25067 [Zizania palustris]
MDGNTQIARGLDVQHDMVKACCLLDAKISSHQAGCHRNVHHCTLQLHHGSSVTSRNSVILSTQCQAKPTVCFAVDEWIHQFQIGNLTIETAF